ncbi:hypothetical protein ACO0LV_05205 [Pseudactinotalea sp. Z1739]|uniref:hypothetical protein n=1 Tax=Pseudactinotalea sp. Z1739 TaxID=3413028 RepID=UPI003C79E371
MSTLMNIMKIMTGLDTGACIARTDADLRPRGDRAPGAAYGAFGTGVTTIGFAAGS